jgi:hypothetical protein
LFAIVPSKEAMASNAIVAVKDTVIHNTLVKSIQLYIQKSKSGISCLSFLVPNDYKFSCLLLCHPRSHFTVAGMFNKKTFVKVNTALHPQK